jgi:hypothetical protein
MNTIMNANNVVKKNDVEAEIVKGEQDEVSEDHPKLEKEEIQKKPRSNAISPKIVKVIFE